MKNIIVLILATIMLVSVAYGQGKNSKLEKAIIDEIFDDEEIGGKGKHSAGRPDNPGQHGRNNAAYKKAKNPGKGGGKNSSLGGALLDEVLDEADYDYDKGGKKKGKGKNK